MAKWCNKPIPNVEKGVAIPIDEITGDIAELVVARIYAKMEHKSKMTWSKLFGKYHLKELNHTRKRFRRNYGKH